MEKVHTFKKYKQNLCLLMDYDNDLWVQSYDTLVARIEAKNLIQLNYLSMTTQIHTNSKTTQKHINYVAKEMNLKLVKP
jgi:hypothetical protein